MPRKFGDGKDFGVREYLKEIKCQLDDIPRSLSAFKGVGRFYRSGGGFSYLLESPCQDIRPYFRIDADHTAFLAYILDSATRDFEPVLPAPDAVVLDQAAVTLLTAMVEVDATWRHGLLLLAQCLLARGDHEQAFGAARKAHQLSPNCHFGERVLRDVLRGYKASGRDVNDLGLSVFEQTLLRDFSGRYCHHPFRNFEVDEVGDVHICCGALVGGAAIGNVQRQNHEEIWNSDVAKAFRESCTDGSFQYCSRSCGLLMADTLPKTTELPKSYQHPMVTGPRFINLKHDVTCNLWCASCRHEVIVANKDQRRQLDVVRDQVIFPLLRDDVEELRIAGGELFASKHYREIVGRLSRAAFPSLKIRIVTNGNLLTEREWKRFPHLAEMIECLEVSVDAATEQTYRRVRRGGNWKALQTNLEGIGRRHRAGLIPEFQLNFVVQKMNYREMPDFVRMALHYGARVRFDPVHNQLGAFLDEQYAEANIYHPDHPEFEDFLRVLDDPVLTGDNVLLIRPERPNRKPSQSVKAPPCVSESAGQQLQIILTIGEQISVVDGAVAGLLDGWFERIEDETAQGWIWSPAFPDVRLPIRVWSNGELIAECVANRSREDLKRAGKGDGCCGFAITLPSRAEGWRKEDLAITIGRQPGCMRLRA